MPTPSVEKAIRSRVLPTVSIRVVMVIVTASVVIAWLGRLAFEGHPLARAIMAGLLSLAAFFIASIVLFLLAWIPAFLMRRGHGDALMGNPFAADQLPPQILPPKSARQ